MGAYLIAACFAFGFGVLTAAQLRSASGYVHHLRDNPEERLLVGRDEDLAARLVKQACEEGGLTYDETIEMHQAGCVLALRRTPS